MATEKQQGITRRRFLSGMLTASATAVIGTSLLAPRKAMAATDAKSTFSGEVIHGSHWGAFRAKVETVSGSTQFHSNTIHTQPLC